MSTAPKSRSARDPDQELFEFLNSSEVVVSKSDSRPPSVGSLMSSRSRRSPEGFLINLRDLLRPSIMLWYHSYCLWLSVIKALTRLFTTYFLLERRYASAGYSDRNVSVRLSVCPSVTRRYCVKTKKASGMISSPPGSPKTLVFRRQISSPNSKGFPRTGASNKGRSEKFSDFLPLSVNISKTVVDTAKVTISH